ncbi:hypothetical protein AUC70_05645 [Methyloceanibacter stevinii]|uniref:Uncharacterized protein n=1 Tax=Methyloceanibacter stevinii TaxID=1774970 RepID=A0A1E3VPG9_9HYPH|nr:hypothetical protein [Methyloceanibacter stevinii]ODR95191.1 hypothetical protein AUC70_05645 [Methyloceanibacter stevinii]
MSSGILFVLGLLFVFGSDRIVGPFTRWVREQSQVSSEKLYPHVPSGLLGTFERALAFVLVAFAVPQTGTILIAWLAAKLAANWQRREGSGNDKEDAIVRANTFIALMGGVLSLGLGALGGLIAGYGLGNYGSVE